MNNRFNNWNLLRSQQQGITRAYQQTQVASLHRATLASIFYEQAAKYGNQLAISFKGEKLTYDELNRRSNQVAYLLCQLGIQSGHVVMILLDRSVEAYIAILGILKAGAAYLPVDPTSPPERVHSILRQSNVHAVLTRSRFLSLIEAQGVNYVIALDELKPFQKAKKRSGKVFERGDIALCPDKDLPVRSNATDLAYIIYTSGSTGAPKGVMIEQQSVINVATWAQRTFGLTHQSRIAQNYSIAFDASVQEIFSAWASGATLYPIPEDIQINPALFVIWLREHAITYWDTIPSLWYQIVHFVASQSDEKSIAFPQLEVLVLGGEVLHADQIREWVKFVSHPHKIYNVYGPTEATVTTTYYQILPDEKCSSVAIGKPVDNAEVYILDENLHQCMPNTEGEIWIGGIGLARGYLNAEELTRAAFLFLDLPSKGRQRMYRTGDFGKLLPDGNLEFVGRRDEQVKVRGYRIELAEIEIALRSYPGVEDAVVLVKDEGTSRKIIAYSIHTSEEISVNELREYLREKIPHYMIPHHFIQLTAMPRTANNKVDKAALIQFAHKKGLRQNEVYQEPTTRTEKILAGIWTEVLHLEKISVHDNFFALGGDSILSIMIRNTCESEGLHLKTADLFRYSTIKTLARYIDSSLHELQLSSTDSPAQHTSAIVLAPGERKRLPTNGSFTEEHNMFREFVRGFIEREINPFVDQWETEGTFPVHELYKKMGNEGLLGLTYPEQYGGLNLDFWYTVIWMEELGRIEAGGVPMSVTVQTEISTPAIAKYGTPKLKQQYLQPAILGDFIGALAITEPDAGSDVTAISTVADEYDDSYIINGRKSYITNGSIADFIVTLCKTSSTQGSRGMSLLLVPAKSAGLIATQKYRKLGNFCCDHAELTFKNVQVSKENIIGMKGMGFDIQMEQFQHERLIEGILACAQAKNIVHKAKEYAKNRMIFGQRLIDHQSVAFSLVNMETELEFLQQMTYYCTDVFIKGHECTREIAMIKLKAGKLLRLVTDECLQLLGGYGYMEGTSIARAYRDGRATALTGGSVETMQHILTKFL